MFFKISILAVLLMGSAQCLEYPAGVSPKDCPNYPYCGMGYAPTMYPYAYAYPRARAYPNIYPFANGYDFPSSYAYPTGYIFPGVFDYATAHNMLANAPAASEQKVTETEVSVESATATMEPAAAPALEPAAPTLLPAAPTLEDAAAPMEASGALRYPADVDPASCPNYPFCS